MARARKILKWTAVGAGILVAVLLVVLIAVGTWVVLNPAGAWRVAQKHFLPQDLKVAWRDIDFEPKWKTWTSFDVRWSIEGLDVQKQDPLVSLPADLVAVDLGLDLFANGPNVFIRDLQFRASQTIRFKPSPSTQEAEVKSYFQQLQDALGLLDRTARIAVLKQLKVSIDDLQILSRSGGRPIRLKVAAERLKDSQQLAQFEVSVVDVAPPAVDIIALKGQLDFSQVGLPAAFLKGEIEIRGRGLSVQGPLSLRYHGEQAKLISQLDWTYLLDKKPLHGSTNLDVDFHSRRLGLALYSDVDGIPGPLPRLRGARATLEIPMQDGVLWSEAASNIKIWAPVSIAPILEKGLRRQIEASCKCRVPTQLNVVFEGKAWPGHLLQPKPGRQVITDVKVSIENVRNRLFLVDLNGTLKVERENARWWFTPYVDSTLKVFSYQALRQFIDAKDLMIPAPFDVLEGGIELKASGPVVISYKQERILSWEFPATLAADLRSKDQQVKFNVNAKILTNPDFKKIHFDVQAGVEKFRIELPPLDPLRGLPKLARDSRILMKPAPKVKLKGVELTFDIDVQTTQPGAIQLLYGLADPFVPVSLKFHSAGKDEASGFVQIEPFKLRYLRRTLEVERVRIDVSPTEDGGFPLQGDLKMRQTDYRIAITLAGTTARPQILLSSEPYLSRNDIISVILYDRTADQLVSADAETAGGVEAAMADRAIGLLGLYAFSTTPIKNFSYNSVTKVYTATVQVADGLTAGVGTDLENAAHLEVRKRVSRRWVLTASWNPSDGAQEEAGKVVLQWERRF